MSALSASLEAVREGRRAYTARLQSTRKPYPSDVSEDEWLFVAPYLCLLPEDAAQRRWPLREVFNGLRWIVRTGVPWRLMPHDLPPWWVVQ